MRSLIGSCTWKNSQKNISELQAPTQPRAAERTQNRLMIYHSHRAAAPHAAQLTSARDLDFARISVAERRPRLLRSHAFRSFRSSSQVQRAARERPSRGKSVTPGKCTYVQFHGEKASRFVRGWSVSEAGARSPEQLYRRPRKRCLSATGM